jgi:hypothetical protein
MSHSFYSNYSRKVNPSIKSTTKTSVPLPIQENPATTATTTTAPSNNSTETLIQPVPKVSKYRRKPSFQIKKKKRKQRPSLSEQLASIGNEAEKITINLRNKHGITVAASILFTMPALSFVVGRIESKSPSPVEFHSSYCAFSFQHPYQTKTRIDMKMQYSHMKNVVVKQDKISGNTFEFKINTPLKHYGIDYDPGKRDHVVRIKLASGTDANRIKKDILPRIRR